MRKAILKKVLHLGGVDIKRYNKAFDGYQALWEKYRDYTMIEPHTFSLNLELCQKYAHVKGDFIECGTWRGGMSAAVAEVLGPERPIRLYDSFEGLPPSKSIDGKEAQAWQEDTTSDNYYNNCAASESSVYEAMRMAGHSRFVVHKGWFEKTVPGYQGQPIGILRLDGDWYDSIIVCLEHLFPHIAPGGVAILDDYYTWDGCTRAAHDYLARSQSPSRIHQWKDNVAYIVKNAGTWLGGIR